MGSGGLRERKFTDTTTDSGWLVGHGVAMTDRKVLQKMRDACWMLVRIVSFSLEACLIEEISSKSV